MKTLVRGALRRCGVDVVRYLQPGDDAALPRDASDADRTILRRIAGLTMTSLARQMALIQAVRHLSRQRIAGCIVECGVWRGGSSMAAAITLLQEGDAERELFLFDTFSGMTAPTALDRMPDGTPAQERLARDVARQGEVWAVAGLADVRRNMLATGYPAARMHLIKGAVEDTLPAQAPAAPIALLRLDTDWYASTRHELEQLYPRLCPGGILLIDDYGDWQGARQAVDEYFAGSGAYLQRIDDTGRLLVKA